MKVSEVSRSPLNLVLRHGVNTRRLFSAVSVEKVEVGDSVQTHSWAHRKACETGRRDLSCAPERGSKTPPGGNTCGNKGSARASLSLTS